MSPASTVAAGIFIEKALAFPGCTGEYGWVSDQRRTNLCLQQKSRKKKHPYGRIENMEGKGNFPQTIIFMFRHKNSIHQIIIVCCILEKPSETATETLEIARQ